MCIRDRACRVRARRQLPLLPQLTPLLLLLRLSPACHLGLRPPRMPLHVLGREIRALTSLPAPREDGKKSVEHRLDPPLLRPAGSMGGASRLGQRHGLCLQLDSLPQQHGADVPEPALFPDPMEEHLPMCLSLSGGGTAVL